MTRLAELMRAQPKYRARATSCGVHVHASKKEAARCVELRLLYKSGEIVNLISQPRYDLIVNGVKICTYRADFSYTDKRTKKTIVEDVKGVRLPMFVIKKKLMRAVHGIEINEV